MASSSKWFSNKSFKLSLPGGRKPGSPQTPPATPQQPDNALEFSQVFRYFDGNGDGKISSHELMAFFASRGEEISLELVESVIGDLDSDGDRSLDYRDFVQLMEKRDEEGSKGDDQEDLKMAFEMYEAEKGSGCITPKSLQRMFSQLGDDKSFEECKAMIQPYDLDGNGVIDFQEFQQMMMA